MENFYDFERQFELTPRDFLAKLDLLNWFRYFFIIKKLVELAPLHILEVGPGEGTIQRVYKPFAEEYVTIDVNERLHPTFKADVREIVEEAKGRFDAVVAADILEHIPFEDLPRAMENIYAYLKESGYALITIPHRSHYLFWMTSLTHKPHLIRTPTLKRLLWGRAAIDPDHKWEIGDGWHTIADVERVMREAGFKIESRRPLLYVDFWVLKK
jgi:SAM-dependent methyltransferase